jgi:TonB family protein
MKNKLIAMIVLLIAFGTLGIAQEARRTMKTKATPAFPELAKRMNVAGSVKVEVLVAPNGAVKSAKALGGHPLLIDAAVTAAKNSKYESAPEESKELITYNFNSSN